MGYGSYSHEAHRAISKARQNVPREQVFKQTACHPLMDPHGVKLRESRDSPTHPNSIGVVFALDVTGSMGDIPDLLARRELPTFMKTLLDSGVEDPQILFIAVGDAYVDRAPLQVGQFESSEREMDQWLTWSFLEGGGGGQNTESYELGMYFIARHTAMDCWDKRQKRGYLFMTGDEEPYPYVAAQQVRQLIGDELNEDIPVRSIVDEVQQMYEPFFLIPDQRRRGRCERTWRDLMGDHVICMDSPNDTCRVAAGLVALNEGVVNDLDELVAKLRQSGASKKDVGGLVRALTPFAATLRRDGTPAPRMDGSDLPAGDGPSGHRRR